MPSHTAEKLKTSFSSLSCNRDAGYKLDSIYHMHINEIGKTEASPLGQQVLESIKFSHCTFQCPFQLPGCEEAHAEEVVARFHV